MSDIRLGDITFADTADCHAAFWRSIAETEATFLCSIKSSALSDPDVSRKFRELAAAVAGHIAYGTTPIGAAPSARWYDTLPCMTCSQPQADDVRHLCGQVTELSALQLSPSGLPVACCKVHVAGTITGMPDRPSSRPPPPTRRMARRY
jgi:hypothetical protein